MSHQLIHRDLIVILITKRLLIGRYEIHIRSAVRERTKLLKGRQPGVNTVCDQETRAVACAWTGARERA